MQKHHEILSFMSLCVLQQLSDNFVKPGHTARGFTNISYIENSLYLYGHTKPYTVKRKRKLQKACL